MMSSVTARAATCAWVVLLLAAGASAADIGATVVDRQGNRYELSKIQIRGESQLSYYLDGNRRSVPLSQVSRFRFGSSPTDEQQAFTVHLRTGVTEAGTFILSMTIPNADVLGGGGMTENLSGSTQFGPFSMRLRDVNDVVLHHPDGGGPLPAPQQLVVTLVTEKGRRFEVEELRYRGKREFAFQQGRRRRSFEMSRIARIDFKEPSSEERSVTIALRSGRTIVGTVDASTVRLSGERDQQYRTRVGSAFTGRTHGMPFAVGLHDVRLIVFQQEASEEDSTAATADSTL